MVRAKKKFTRFLLIIVSGMGLCSTAFLLTDPPPADPSNIDYDSESLSLFSRNSAAIAASDLSRNPSSVPNVEIKPDSVFEFRCGEETQTFETAKARFRLKGNSCLTADDSLPANSGSHALATQVQNESNGYVATVFHRTPQSFTTDYINLSEGKNKIKLVFDGEDGNVEKTLIVVRTSPLTKK